MFDYIDSTQIGHILRYQNIIECIKDILFIMFIHVLDSI